MMSRLYARAVFYPTLWWNMLLGRVLKVRNWWDVVEEGVVLGARPFARDVAKLDAMGVKAVVNTCEEYSGPEQEYERFGINQLWIPTVDFTHPKLEDVESGVEFMQQALDDDHSVYVHCKAGRARSATIVICWLIKHRGFTAEQAQKLLLERRPHVNSKLPERPVVQEFERKWGLKRYS